ncbi:endonuclease/exonuclease/phosphatase family protein [Seongchinamella sediminis]|uniref:Endonuclease/exonuclease/phosphatase family protein n=1 Tax=Seongchinamella sediminis TaxID=2283635 RepID=A0A3L7E2K3_9GAMM|nr:endonuclease/exonuclease/phosphatase family protein [Seongchinamella sediminis]
MKIVSWNINRQTQAWRVLRDSEYDIALVQEAGPPPAGLLDDSDISPGEWSTAGAIRRPWRTAIVRLSKEVDVEWVQCRPLELANSDDFPVSRRGTIAAARVSKPGLDPILLCSCYSVWERMQGTSEIFSDGSAHRLLSDLSWATWSEKRVIVAGDFNILNRYGENRSQYWGRRYTSVFDRAKTIGLEFAGPQYPQGRQASPWPDELPEGSKDVPTYYPRQRDLGGATRQIDFVFCSPSLKSKLSTEAKNQIDDWGPSDHCRIEIKVND